LDRIVEGLAPWTRGKDEDPPQAKAALDLITLVTLVVSERSATENSAAVRQQAAEWLMSTGAKLEMLVRTHNIRPGQVPSGYLAQWMEVELIVKDLEGVGDVDPMCPAVASILKALSSAAKSAAPGDGEIREAIRMLKELTLPRYQVLGTIR
jgi:hypothetical protein